MEEQTFISKYQEQILQCHSQTNEDTQLKQGWREQ
jgi:hypothetical protein